MSGPSRASAAAVLAIAVTAAFVVATIADGNRMSFWLVPVASSIVAFAGVGAFLVRRVPTNRIGTLLLLAATLTSAGTTLSAFSFLGAAASPRPWPGTAIAALLSEPALFAATLVVLIGIPLVFPDGSLLSRRWRLIVWITVAVIAARLIGTLLRPGQAGETELDNPLGAPGLVPFLDLVDAILAASSVVGFGSAAVAVVIRFRRAGGIERQQLKWFLAIAGLAAVMFPAPILVPESVLASVSGISLVITYLSTFLLTAMPIAIGFAILRYRLYDIDRIISRTIAYGLVTGLLAIVFGGTIVLLQTVLAPLTQGRNLAVAASTVAVFVLFQPILRRVRRAVDGRFDRARYDADRTAAAFSDRLRGQVDVDRVTSELAETTARALAPSSFAIWVRGDADRAVTIPEPASDRMATR